MKVKAFRFRVEKAYKKKITPNHVLYPWLVRHAGWIVNRYRRRGDGLTSYHAITGTGYTGEIVPFGETVLYKIPITHERLAKGGVLQHKLDSGWEKGLWIGKHDRSDDHMMLTAKGMSRARTVRRLTGEARYDKNCSTRFRECRGCLVRG